MVCETEACTLAERETPCERCSYHSFSYRLRVLSMALVHENLYRAGNFARSPMGTDIRKLRDRLVSAYDLPSRPVKLVIAVDDILSRRPRRGEPLR